MTSTLTSAHYTTLSNLVIGEIMTNGKTNNEYLYSLLGKLTVRQQLEDHDSLLDDTAEALASIS